MTVVLCLKNLERQSVALVAASLLTEIRRKLWGRKMQFSLLEQRTYFPSLSPQV